MISDFETAKEVSISLLNINNQLTESFRMVKHRVSHSEAKAYGRIIDRIFEAILEPIYREHPSLKPPDLEM